ncbi:MAG: hypothetical protein M5R38_13555 [Candidatus Methylomirabilis sp.]|nr:hypothetical protein [Candidatus Methylomirabilis sp.]
MMSPLSVGVEQRGSPPSHPDQRVQVPTQGVFQAGIVPGHHQRKLVVVILPREEVGVGGAVALGAVVAVVVVGGRFIAPVAAVVRRVKRQVIVMTQDDRFAVSTLQEGGKGVVAESACDVFLVFREPIAPGRTAPSPMVQIAFGPCTSQSESSLYLKPV